MLDDHQSISVGQAIFTSSRESNGRGYHLVARSCKVSDELARHLSRWGPAHGSLLTDSLNGSCFNFMAIDSQWTTISRTMYGGPEYSHRGALQVVTMFMALHHEDLAGYDNDPMTFARTAMLLGHLRLSAMQLKELPDIHLPVRPPYAVVNEHAGQSADDAILERTTQLLDQGERIALVAGQSASTTLQGLFARTPETSRLQLSFTTGLKPSPDRRFRIHLLPFIDPKLHRQLTALDIRVVATSA